MGELPEVVTKSAPVPIEYQLPRWFLDHNVTTFNELAQSPDAIEICDVNAFEVIKADIASSELVKDSPCNVVAGDDKHKIVAEAYASMRETTQAAFVSDIKGRMPLEESCIIWTCTAKEGLELLESGVQQLAKDTKASLINIDFEDLKDLRESVEPEGKCKDNPIHHQRLVSAILGSPILKRELTGCHDDELRGAEYAPLEAMSEEMCHPVILHLKDPARAEDHRDGFLNAMLKQIFQEIMRKRELGEPLVAICTAAGAYVASAVPDKVSRAAGTLVTVVSSTYQLSPLVTSTSRLLRERAELVRRINTRALKRALRKRVPSALPAELLEPCSNWPATNEASVNHLDYLGQTRWPSDKLQQLVCRIVGRTPKGATLKLEDIQSVLEQEAIRAPPSLHGQKKQKQKQVQQNAAPRDPWQEKVDAVLKSCNEAEEALIGDLVSPEKVSASWHDLVIDQETRDIVHALMSMTLLSKQVTASSELLLDRLRIRGALLYGPPGTGKTLLARVLAKESGASMLAVDQSSINHSLVGATEKSIRAAFTLAEKFAPCILFIDEVDALFYRRNSQDTPWRRAALTQFLSQMDGLNRSEKAPFVLVATNRPMDLDNAFLRRLPQKIMLGPPNTVSRSQILKIFLTKNDLDPLVDITELATRTKGYSGSDLRNLCSEAALFWLIEQGNPDTSLPKKGEVVISEDTGVKPPSFRLRLHPRHFWKALRKIKPSISQDMLLEIEDFARKYDPASFKDYDPDNDPTEHTDDIDWEFVRNTMRPANTRQKPTTKASDSRARRNSDDGGADKDNIDNEKKNDNINKDDDAADDSKTARSLSIYRAQDTIKRIPRVPNIPLRRTGGFVSELQEMRYNSLPSNHIRILELSAGQFEDPLLASLETVSLEKPPHYHALSYTWGSSDPPHYISCMGTEVQITKNLFDALRTIRKSDASLKIWVDAFCINQKDDREKSSQVSMMREIYAKAEKLVIWIGNVDTPEEADLALHTFHTWERKLARHIDLDKLRLPWKLGPDALFTSMRAEVFLDLLGWHPIRDTAKMLEAHPSLKSLGRFYSMPWFSRVWVLQEAISISGSEKADITVVYGRRKMSWDTCAVVSGALCVFQDLNTHVMRSVGRSSCDFPWPTVRTIQMERKIARVSVHANDPELSQAKLLDLVEKSCKGNSHLSANIRLQVDKNDSVAWKPLKTLIETTLASSSRGLMRQGVSHADCTLRRSVHGQPRTGGRAGRMHIFLDLALRLDSTDPRDKVYAFAGLLNDEIGDSTAFTPDYGKSVVETFTDVTLHFIQRDGGLDIFELHCAGGHAKPRQIPGLPSWVVDWTQKIDYEVFFTEKFCAGGKMLDGATCHPAVKPHLSPDRACLQVFALLVDELTQIAPTAEEAEHEYAPAARQLCKVAAPMGEDRYSDASRMERHIIWARYTNILLRAKSVEPTFSNQNSNNSSVWSPPSKTTPYVTGGSLYEAFWRTLICDLEGEIPRTDVEQAFLTHHNAMDIRSPQWQQHVSTLFQHESPDAKRITAFRHEHTRYTESRRFAVSRKGFMGWVPRFAQAGDMICILPGARTPYILRKDGKGQRDRWEMVGHAYVHGLMEDMIDPVRLVVSGRDRGILGEGARLGEIWLT